MNYTLKYPTIKMFFDADTVPCVFVDDIKKMFVGIHCLPNFGNKCWDIPTVEDKNKSLDVMAVADLEVFIDLLCDKTKYRFVNYDANKLMNIVNGAIYDKKSGNFLGTD